MQNASHECFSSDHVLTVCHVLTVAMLLSQLPSINAKKRTRKREGCETKAKGAKGEAEDETL